MSRSEVERRARSARRDRRRQKLRTSLWLVPLLCIVLGAGLSATVVAIDRAHDHGLISQAITGDPTAAQTALSTMAAAMVSLVSLVLSLTLIAVQLAMNRYSPRIVRSLLSDRRSQLAVGLFFASFVHDMLAMREVPDQGTVPGLTMLTAYALTIATIVALVLYVHSAGMSLRAAGLIDLVGDGTRAQIDMVYDTPIAEQREDPATIVAAEPGVLHQIDRGGLIASARHAGCVLELVPVMGDFVCAGAPLLRVHGSPARPLAHDRIREMVGLGSERTHLDDVAYGLRKLVDIAERSVADPFDDPTTAVQAIDRLHDAIRQLATRELATGRHEDEDAELRLVERTLSWEGYVRLAFDELRLVGAPAPQVARRLRAALDDLIAFVPADRRSPLERQRELLEAGVRRAYDDEEDVEAGLIADQQGIGSGADVVHGWDASGNGRAPAGATTPAA
jgi:uncharacterized membrane protein